MKPAALSANQDWIRTGRGDPHRVLIPREEHSSDLIAMYESAPKHIQAAILAAARALTDS